MRDDKVTFTNFLAARTMGFFGRFELGQSERLLNFRACHNITKYKIVETLRRMTTGKEISEIVYFRACHNITKYKIVEALRRMTTGKAISEIENRRRLVQIVYLVEIWKCLSEGLNWLTRFLMSFLRHQTCQRSGEVV